MRQLGGRCEVYGRVAYAPQSAFLLNTTIKENILFGLPFDGKRYKAAVHDSALGPDLKMLPGGDACRIGDRGEAGSHVFDAVTRGS